MKSGNTNNTNPAKPGDAGSSGVPQQALNVQAAIAAQYGQLTPAMAQKLHLAQQQQQHAQAFSNPHAVQNIQQAAAFAALQQGFNGYQAKNATGQTLPPMTPEAIALFNRQQQLNALNLQRAKSLANQPTQGASTVPSSQSTMQSNPQGTQDLTKSPTPGPAASPKLTAATTAPKSTSSDTPIPNDEDDCCEGEKNSNGFQTPRV
ncbi:hypothetical protein BKA69DRAFT_16823 [Paraphysoderma sedebokerense]|nr:hypothetical protein BKA69DRAFT_16823 [Paraphysoderma sedebokerense]